MGTLTKDWDSHVIDAEEVARSQGFQDLGRAVVEAADAGPGDRVLDIGAGTGLLTLPLAKRADQVWALDIAPAMCAYLHAKATSGGTENIETVVASAVSLPLVDGSFDVVVSNYCFHHLRDEDKLRALQEINRVLVPGGRLVFADMMFRVALTTGRDRRVVGQKVRAMLRKGPAGVARLAKNGLRFVSASWEKPARVEWWKNALHEVGFTDVTVEALPHEGGLARARKPGREP